MRENAANASSGRLRRNSNPAPLNMFSSPLMAGLIHATLPPTFRPRPPISNFAPGSVPQLVGFLRPFYVLQFHVAGVGLGRVDLRFRVGIKPSAECYGG